MGWFSTKKKKIVGVSNTRLIPEGENPQTLKDSVAGYISDFGKENGNISGTMTSYMNDGIDKSIVNGVKRLNRWVKKPGLYSTVGEVRGNMDTLTDEDVRNDIATYIEDLHNTTINFYYLNNFEYDYGHFSKQVLIDKYSYDPTTNKLLLNNQELYLVDAVISSNVAIPLETLHGPAFTAGYTPYRVQDNTRAYTISNIVLDTISQFEFFDTTAVNELYIDSIEYITKTTVVTSPPPAEPVEGQPPPEPVAPTTETSIVSNGTEVINNIPVLNQVSQIFTREEDLSETTNTVVTEDPATYKTTTVEDITLTHREFFECTYVFRDTYSEYFYSQYPDWALLTDEEVLAILATIKEKDIRIQVAYDYVDILGQTIMVYKTFTEQETSFLDTANTVVPFGSFLPNLYFKHAFQDFDKDKTSTRYKQSKMYAKKLNLDYADLSKEIREGVENQDKIMHTYLKFGVNFNSTDEVDILYLFYFFESYFQYCDLSNTYGFNYNYVLNQLYPLAGKVLNFKDNLLEYRVGVLDIAYIIKEESVIPVGAITKGVGVMTVESGIDELGDPIYSTSNYTFFRKQITETTYEEYRVQGVTTMSYVTDGKWASPDDGNATLLLPVDFSIMNKIKGFKKKERFLYNCIYVEFLTLVIQKIKWYQRGFFKLIVFAISVVISVYTGGVGMSLNALLTAAVVNLAIGVAIDITIKLLLQVLSPELVKILALAIIAVGLLSGHTNVLNGLKNVSAKAFTILTMKADLIVKFGTQLVTSANQAQIAEIKESFLKEARYQKDRMKDLEKYKLTNSKYSPNTNTSYLDEDIRYNPVVFGEGIDAMIARSLNSNPALVAINYVHGYVDFILTLPTPAETVYKPITDV